MCASWRTKWRLAPAGARGIANDRALLRRAVDGRAAGDDDRRSRQTTTKLACIVSQGGLHAEMENRGDSRIGFWNGRRHLGLCAAGPGAGVLRAAGLHGAARKTGCAGRALRKSDGGDLRTAWNHKCGLLDSTAK